MLAMGDMYVQVPAVTNLMHDSGCIRIKRIESVRKTIRMMNAKNVITNTNQMITTNVATDLS